MSDTNQASKVQQLEESVGFGAPASAGDKTQVIDDYTGTALTAGMITALNGVSAGTGDAIGALRDHVVKLRKALQAALTALESRQLPLQ